MNIAANCGHEVAVGEGPDGAGWPIATRGFSADGKPVISQATYCTACRDGAIVIPGFVVTNQAKKDAWLNANLTDLVILGEVREPVRASPMPGFHEGNQRE